MFIRYRWYRIKIPCEATNFIRIFSTNPLTQESNFGFLYIEDSLGLPKIRFLWRAKVVVTRLDDDGNPAYDEIASVNFTDFSVVSVGEKLFLRIENPGRNIRDLLNTLESLVGFGFTSKAMTFEKSTTTTLFENVEVAKLIGLKIIDAVINKNLVARIEFASKQGIDSNKIPLLDGFAYKTDSSVYDLVYEGIRGQVAFSSSGIVKISGKLAPRLISLIEQDLLKIE